MNASLIGVSEATDVLGGMTTKHTDVGGIEGESRICYTICLVPPVPKHRSNSRILIT